MRAIVLSSLALLVAGCAHAPAEAVAGGSAEMLLTVRKGASEVPAGARRIIADETQAVGALIDWPERGGLHLVDELQQAVGSKCVVDRLGDPERGIDETALHIRCNASAFFALGKDTFLPPPSGGRAAGAPGHEWIDVGTRVRQRFGDLLRLEIVVVGSVDGVPIDPSLSPVPSPSPSPALSGAPAITPPGAGEASSSGEPAFVPCPDLRKEMSFGADWKPVSAAEAAAERRLHEGAPGSRPDDADDVGPLRDRANRELSWCRAARTGSALLLGLRLAAADVHPPVGITLVGAGSAWYRRHKDRCAAASDDKDPRNCGEARRVDVYLRFVPKSAKVDAACRPEGLSPRRLLACYEQNIARRRSRFVPADRTRAEVPFFADEGAAAATDDEMILYRLGGGPLRLGATFREMVLDGPATARPR